MTRGDATPRAREQTDAADVPDCIETAVAFMAAQDGAVQRVLAVHRRRPDGRCTGCVYRLTWWPCTVAGIAIRVEMANDLHARGRRADHARLCPDRFNRIER